MNLTRPSNLYEELVIISWKIQISWVAHSWNRKSFVRKEKFIFGAHDSANEIWKRLLRRVHYIRNIFLQLYKYLYKVVDHLKFLFRFFRFLITSKWGETVVRYRVCNLSILGYRRVCFQGNGRRCIFEVASAVNKKYVRNSPWHG